jgi:hypothetical protein
MACKDKCCCAKERQVKRRPAKKRKSTVGKVSATQLLAQSIASLALPRRVNEPFLYGNSALGEAQKFAKPEPIVGPAVAVAPSAPLPPIPKPAKYSRQQMKPMEARPEIKFEEPSVRPRGEKVGISVDVIKEEMKKTPQPYSPFLGFDIPVKTTKKGPDGKDMFIQKESGLFVPETRGGPTLEQRRALPPGQKKLTDFFRDNL